MQTLSVYNGNVFFIVVFFAFVFSLLALLGNVKRAKGKTRVYSLDYSEKKIPREY